MEWWNDGYKSPVVPIIPYSIIPLFGAAGGTAGGGTAPAGRTGGAFKLSAARKGKGRHRPVNFLALTFRAGNLLRGIKN